MTRPAAERSSPSTILTVGLPRSAAASKGSTGGRLRGTPVPESPVRCSHGPAPDTHAVYLQADHPRRAAGLRPRDRTVKEELRENLLPGWSGGEAAVPRDRRLRGLGHPGARARHPRRPRPDPPRRTRPGEDPPDPPLVDLLDELTPVIAGCEVNDHPYRPICARCRALVAERGRRDAGRLAPARPALRGEARHARHERRRPGRRRRPDPRRRGPLPVRRADDPLRPDPAHPPRHRRDQRAPRPPRADPGRAVQHPRGARRPDPRLPGPAAARPAAGRDGEPRGLHAPRPHRVAAEGPVRHAGPNPLPGDARRRGPDHGAGGAPARRRAPFPCASPRS